MGTGVGEAMLIGAVTGAGTSAITGGDPLKGALFGLAGGAMGPMLGSALGGSTAGTVAGAAPGTVAQTALQSALPEMGVQTAASAAPASIAPGSLQAAMSDLGVQTATQTAAQNAVNPSLVSTAGSSTGAITPTTGFSDIFKSTAGGPDFGQRVGNYLVQNPTQAAMGGSSLANMMFNKTEDEMPDNKYKGPLSRFIFDPERYRPGFASGGIADLPVSKQYAGGGHLGGYSDGGRLLKGPGDGMSDSIPAKIGRRQPARLADGEFVVPADVVSHLGNGSTDAGAKQLYAMMDKIRAARTGNKKQGKEINPRKYLPA